jgi:NADH:ubiquinone oxidoreductase subunit 3 (subunit A)
MHIVALIIYILLCYIVGLLGKNRKFKFIGYFLLSIIFTPILGLLFVIASDSRKRSGLVYNGK